jgi:hypothetical protein
MAETREMVTRDNQPTAEVWEIPRRVWFILLSWGLGVLVLAGLLSFWIWETGRESDRQAAEAKLQQDRAMCAMIGVFLEGPEPVAGPAGDRSRSVRAGMRSYQEALRCDVIGRAPR